MSYCAEGYGELFANQALKIPDDVIEKAKAKCDEFAYVSNRLIYVEYYFGNYNEEDVVEFCKLIAPYVNDGSIYFKGEDCTRWRYHYVKGKFIEENGVIEYEIDSKSTKKDKLIVADIVNNDTFTCDIRVIRFEDYEPDAKEIKDLWNTWEYGGDIPFDIMDRKIKMANVSDDNVLVLMI